MGSDGELDMETEATDLDENFPKNSSLPQTPEQEKYLKHHFETLADAHAEEKFDGCLKDLKPPEDVDDGKHLFLNPRLSISARFLSRCQKNSRFAAFLPRARQQLQNTTDATDQSKEESKLSSEHKKSEKPLEEKPIEVVEKTDSSVCSPSETQILMKCFETNLQPLRAAFQETLQLYDKLTSHKESTEKERLQVKTMLANTFSWMKTELDSRAVKNNADVATATDSPSPQLKSLHDNETLYLLKHYSESLVRMVQKKLDDCVKPE